VDLFKSRGVWELDLPAIEHWTASNQSFFSAVNRFVPRAGKILELGCGPGRHAISLGRLGYRVTGIDNNPAVVQRARANAAAIMPAETITLFQQGDISNLSEIFPQNAFDAITHGGLMEHFHSVDGNQPNECNMTDDLLVVLSRAT
jgi:SAM-dependent methyltransferase